MNQYFLSEENIINQTKLFIRFLQFDKNELNKLSRLISRTKKKYSIEIVYQKGSYSLINSARKSA